MAELILFTGIRPEAGTRGVVPAETVIAMGAGSLALLDHARSKDDADPASWLPLTPITD